MITSKTAIEKAITFLESLKPDYLGGEPKSIRLETIQLFDKEWVVILSYTILTPRPEAGLVNSLAELLSSRRYFKEFEINAQSGDVIAMRNPQAPAATLEHQPA